MRALTLLLLAATLTVLGPVPRADAAARISLANSAGTAAIDPTYATELRVSGSGFQAVEGGHGGVYVFFGTVSGGWRPSQGGATGRDYFYVPDSEARNNNGYQRYVAFPGSDTAGSANGGTMSAAGTFSTTVTVPGAVFKAVDRNGATRTIDCRTTTCGIITVGAHGVVNANNETFTPVRVTDLVDDDEAGPGEDATTPADPGEVGTTPADGAVGTEPEKVKLGPVRLEVDRTSARAGNVLSFTASGLTPRAQVTAILDDGVAANGPFVVGDDGRLAGVVAVPASAGAGTHELRLYGQGEGSRTPTVRFALAAADAEAEPIEPVAAQSTDDEQMTAAELAPWFFGVAAVVLLLALVRLLVARRSRPRTGGAGV
ncbi:hypothetical protein [Nocardioides sambongensis]|uniref:hypothetical protein n=1 Tax=Nocardioides sambongensis TaxID=2589074 RepID=UPI00112A7B35|nr:hypothetical protein [Nocardioides sambongensis]